MNPTRWLCAALLVGACSSQPAALPQDGPTFVYGDPDRMIPFPSDRFLAHDGGARPETHERATGYHIDVEPFRARDPIFAKVPEVADGLAGLDGFGTSSEIILGLTFAADVTALTDAATAFERSVADDSPLWLMSIDPASPRAGEPLPFVAFFEPDGNTLRIRPWRPLQASSRHALIVRPGLRDVLGRPFVSPPGFQDAMKHPEAHGLEGDGYAQLRQVFPEPIVFAITFRTASITPKLRSLADEVRAASPSAITFVTRAPATWQPHLATIVEGWFTHRLYLTPQNMLGLTVTAEEKIPFTLALPLTTATLREPFPIVLAQHGFGGYRQWIFDRTADAFAAQGMATVAIDAPNHGARGPGDGLAGDFLTGVRETFGIWTNGDSIVIRSWHFRDLLRQQVLTHLQLLLALEAWNGDVTRATNAPGPDLDVSEAGYIGHSMGAVMGGVSGAVLPELRRILLNVGGGRISDVFAGNEFIDRLAVVALRPRGVSVGEGWRMISMAQATIDPGDPLNYVAHIAGEPFDGQEPRPVLMQNVLHDFLVPNHASYALARAMDAVHVGPLDLEVADLERQRIPPGGLEGNDLTAFAYFDEVRIGGERFRADHSNHIGSSSGLEQAAPFLRSGVVIEPAP